MGTPQPPESSGISAAPQPEPLQRPRPPQVTVPSQVPAGPQFAAPPQALSGQKKPRIVSIKPLVLVLLICGVLLVAGTGTALVLYTQHDDTDRSTPTVVTYQFLRAALVDKDDGKVEQLTCAQWTKDRTEAIRGGLDGASYTGSTVIQQSNSGDRAEVTADLTLKYAGEALPSGVQHWRLDLVDDGGWRVCGVDAG